MAAAVKAALFTFSKSPPSQRVQPEWPCKACGATNWVTRVCCRRCQGPKLGTSFSALQSNAVAAGNGGKSKGGKGKGKGNQAAQGDTWADRVRLAQVKAQSLEQLAAQAKRAGTAAAPQLAEEAKAARMEAKTAKPVHLRLGRTQERLVAAEEKLAAAQAAHDQAAKRMAQAQCHVEEVQAELEHLQQEVAGAQPTGATDVELLIPTVRDLLARLERGRTPDGCEEMAEVVGKLHTLLEETEPTPAGRLDEALPDEMVWGAEQMQRGAKRVVPSDDAEDFADASGDVDAVCFARDLQSKLWSESMSDAAFGAAAKAALGRRVTPF